jgi:hypothetical protein
VPAFSEWRLPLERIGDFEHRTVSDIGVGRQHLFDLAGREAMGGEIDYVVWPGHHVDVAVSGFQFDWALRTSRAVIACRSRPLRSLCNVGAHPRNLSHHRSLIYSSGGHAQRPRPEPNGYNGTRPQKATNLRSMAK